MRIVAVLATYNEERFVAACLEHLIAHGVEVYLIDNASTDRTVEIAERYRGHGLLDIESFPRHGQYTWRPLLQRKEAIAAEIDADWVMHVDADEIRLPPPGGGTLLDAFAEVDRQGYNAVNFMEYCFVPTREAPNHDHPNFQQTMRWYYPFLPWEPHRLNAWRQQPDRVDLAGSGGHEVRFPGLRRYPVSFPMRHYLFLSPAHALEKYMTRTYDPSEVNQGWHGWRAQVSPALVTLPGQNDLRPYRSDDTFDASHPWKEHCLDPHAPAKAESA